MRYNFQGYKGQKTANYTCLGCGKKRAKKFTREHTVNPFNVDANGVPKQASQVQADAISAAKTLAEAFLRHPLCSLCEPEAYSDAGKLVRALRQGEVSA